MKQTLTTTERRVITALYRYERFTNANEVSKLSGVSWATSKSTLIRLLRRGILQRKTLKGILHFRIKEGY